jgi:hypothetical protein
MCSSNGRPVERAQESRNFDEVADLVAQRLAKISGRISAKRLLSPARAAAYGAASQCARTDSKQATNHCRIVIEPWAVRFWRMRRRITRSATPPRVHRCVIVGRYDCRSIGGPRARQHIRLARCGAREVVPLGVVSLPDR